MIRKSTLFILFLTTFTLSCKKESMNCGKSCSYDEELLFQSGFEASSLTNGEYNNASFSGTDTSYPSMNSWEDLNAHENIGKVEISYEDGNDDQRLATIIQDPTNTSNSIMKFQIIEPHIKEGSKNKGRVQLNFSENNCLREIYFSVRLKLDEDLAQLKEWNERVYWFSLFEFWNNADWTKEKFPFRVTVNLFKDDEGSVDQMYFHVKGDHKNNCKTCKWKEDWEYTGSDFAVPFGEWMTIQIYLKEGDENNGRFKMAVQKENETAPTLVFDLTETTQHPDEKCADGFSHFQPMKLYTSEEVINYMKEKNKDLVVYWDDFILYKNKSF